MPAVDTHTFRNALGAAYEGDFANANVSVSPEHPTTVYANVCFNREGPHRAHVCHVDDMFLHSVMGEARH